VVEIFCTPVCYLQLQDATEDKLRIPLHTPIQVHRFAMATGIAATLDEMVQRSRMLDDIVMHTQRWSATLPTDDWEPEKQDAFDVVSSFRQLNQRMIC
jgi:hypothetical protein